MCCERFTVGKRPIKCYHNYNCKTNTTNKVKTNSFRVMLGIAVNFLLLLVKNDVILFDVLEVIQTVPGFGLICGV